MSVGSAGRLAQQLARAVIAVTALVLGHAVPAGSDEARLVVEDTIHDFGTVEQGTVVRHDFSFRNEGDGVLRIDGVRGTCGCTAAVVSESVVPPGRAGTVEVRFDTTEFRGRKTKTVFVSTNDPVRPVRELTLTGEVTVDVVADPPVLYLGRIPPGVGTTATVRILSASGRSLGVQEATASSSAIELAVQPADGGEAGDRVVLRVTGAMPRGHFDDTLRIVSTDPELPYVEVPVFGSVEGDLVVLPPQLTFRVPVRGGVNVRELRVRNLGPEPVAILGVHVPGVPLDYTIHSVRAGFEYRIALRLEWPTPERRRTAVHISTTHPRESEVVVPLYTMNRRRGDVPN